MCLVSITKLTELKNRRRMSKNSRHFTFRPMRSKTKTKCGSLTRFPALLRHLHVLDSILGLSSSFVIVQSDYRGFGFTTLNGKRLFMYGGFHVQKGLFREKTKFFGNLGNFPGNTK